jgi:hypothetical protein
MAFDSGLREAARLARLHGRSRDAGVAALLARRAWAAAAAGRSRVRGLKRGRARMGERGSECAKELKALYVFLFHFQQVARSDALFTRQCQFYR